MKSTRSGALVVLCCLFAAVAANWNASGFADYSKPKREIFEEAIRVSERFVDRDGSNPQREQYVANRFGLNRTTFWYVLALFGAGGDANNAKANAVLDLVLPKEPPGSPTPQDARDMFTQVSAVAVYRLHKNRMTEDVRRRMHLEIVKRVKAMAEFWYPTRLTAHNIGHTNYPIMYLEAIILGSEEIGDRESQKKAYEAFNDWCDYTLENGVSEFNATTYYKENLRCLGNIAAHARDPQVKRRAAAFTEFLWLETAQHYYPPRGVLAGANARNYNPLSGTGGSIFLIKQFLTGEQWELNFPEEVFIAYLDYDPPAYIKEIAREKVRVEYKGLWMSPNVSEKRRGKEEYITPRWRDGAEFRHEYGKDRYTFIEPAYALGIGGAFYARQDRMLVLDFGGSPDKQLCSIAASLNTKAPLEAANLMDMGANHMPTGSAAVQDRNAAMIIYSLSVPEREGELKIVAPTLLLPANTDAAYVNDRPVARAAGAHRLAAGDVLYLQEGDVYVALRFVESKEGFASYAPTYHYRLDGESGKYKVGALMSVLYHGSAKRLTEQNVRAGFVVEAETKKRFATLADFRRHIERETRIEQSYENGVWSVAYRTGGREISIKKDLPRDLILDKRTQGTRFAPPMHETNFSKLDRGVITVSWKGKTHRINLNR